MNDNGWNNRVGIPEPSLNCRRAIFVEASEVEPRAVEWLWPQRIPIGKVSLIAGDPGLGKSFISLDIASRVSTGTPFVDFRNHENPAGSVIILSAEDDIEDTIVPRLEASGADTRKVRCLVSIHIVSPDDPERNPIESAFSLATDLQALEYAIYHTPDLRLVVIDPISAYLGQTDSHKNAEVRAVLAPLSALAAKYRFAVLMVTHLRKSGDGPAIHRMMGSLAFAAAARSVLGAMKDKDDESGKRRLLLPVKNNLGNDTSGLAYSMMPARIRDAIDTATIAWEPEPIEMSADEAMSNDRGAPKQDDAEEWLRELLANGGRDAAAVIERATKAGINEKTLRRAKKAVNIESRRVAGGWEWWLPNPNKSTADEVGGIPY